MADKITELTEQATLVSTDVLPIVNDPAGTPTTKKIKVSTILGAWTTFTPQVYQNGNVTSSNTYCQYIRIGDVVIVRALLSVTSAGSSGQKILVKDMPVSIANHSTTGIYVLGVGGVLDSGATIYAPAVCAHDATTVSFFADGAADFLGVSPAWALANNDTISFTITYKAA